ncbi:sulfurtransferase complex subunit TusC [Parahaliea aestuarii]|uniref:Sulfurtransferase complex subunit TusC n=1 Tax=Parahaliea aestuarii TaxID=1852021 RepID=A0A5C8ZTI9_9GAMM|nr:sulfurtransferase complex subunit TusC [Parahaliea aestuarii]TXS91109.1 sulfurtransferase complex subunit TusC [Parahaliea aestuarii]
MASDTPKASGQAEPPRLLLVTRSPPYGSSLARSALDTALAAAAFDMAPALLFLDHGVLQLLPQQEGAASETRSHGKVLDSLPLYDIDRIYVDAAALLHFGLQDMPLPAAAEVVDSTGIRALLEGCDHILSF